MLEGFQFCQPETYLEMLMRQFRSIQKTLEDFDKMLGFSGKLDAKNDLHITKNPTDFSPLHSLVQSLMDAIPI